MNIGQWAEIRRLAEIEKLSERAISRRLCCSRHLVAAALELDQPPARQARRRTSLLDPHRAKIDALIAKYPDLSAVRVHEEIARGPDGYTGSVITVRRYVRSIRPRAAASTRKSTTSRRRRCRSTGANAAASRWETRPAKSRSWWPCSATAG